MHPEFNVKRERSSSLYAVRTESAFCELHFHSNIELLVVLDGEVDAWVDGRHKVMHAGEMLVALSYDAHRYRSTKPIDAICMIIPADMCTEFAAAVSNKKAGSPFISDRELVDRIRDCYERIKKAKHPLSAQGYLYVIMGALLEHLELKERQETVEVRLFTDILMYLNDHYTEDISLASVAAEMGYNSSYLSRAFRKCFRIGILEYITMLRLRQAIFLMKEGDRSITECAFESGFRSLRTFYRAFAEEFRCTPREYLQQYKP